MNNFKKILLFLFGLALLVFGNRDVLARINKRNAATANDLENGTKAKPVDAEAKKDSTKVSPAPAIAAPKETTLKTGKKSDNSAVTEKEKKARIVVKSEETEESAQPAPTTTIEKAKPEKASSTQ